MSFSHHVIGKRAHAVSHAKKSLKDQKAPPAVIAAVDTLASAFPEDQGVKIETSGHIGGSSSNASIAITSQPTMVSEPATDDPPAAASS